MTKKINLDNFYRIVKSNVFIVFIFAVLSVLSGIYFLKSNVVFNGWDLSFHLSRVYEIHQSIIDGNVLPKIMLNNFSQDGSAVMVMYPSVNLLFMAIGLFIFHSFTHFLYIMFMLRNFLALILAYVSCYSFSKSKMVSFLFSISYTLSVLVLWYNFISTDYGVSTSFIFLPLVVFGTLLLLEKNHWKELTIGMSIIILSHVITAVLSIILVGLLIIINYKRINKSLIISFGKAIGTTLLITSIFSIPFVIMASNNHIVMPKISWLLTGISINDLMGSILSNSVYTPFIGVASFGGLILSIINYKNLQRYSKQLFYISILLIIVASPLFPWNILNNTFIRTTFQRPYRIYIIAQVLLSYLFGENIIALCKNRRQSIFIVLVVTISVIFTQATGQKSIVDSARQNSGNGRPNVYNVNNLANETTSYTDYFPNKGLFLQNDIMNHFATYRNNKKTTVNLLGNGKFIFKLDKSSNSLKMPFLIYDDIDYQVKVDGKNTKFHSGRHSQLTLGHMSKGKHTVQVIVHKSWYDYLSYVLSIVGISMLAFSWIRWFFIKHIKK